jgi:hypothetical protein
MIRLELQVFLPPVMSTIAQESRARTDPGGTAADEVNPKHGRKT